ncbi:MAG: triose-phosphate isomerase [Candidatus Ryanbacteria bacterium RIFCSPHIGHO2_02_FULL_45_43]|uniref:Triosephosphate isomerase n=1 Tax=Candidatus Ryanbacteria bacterium RIFCSPHIGHO2_01_45_13 TaxID=1802112 RepID=A0A1G2FXW6_9BACT|nr:MAG: triose-phosphate isomerase [Candidatus Ryanbacteria bacterium RIFCSPHIGHO2_01_FULL_44_130]OGZ42448.1 MAG: triose-phosphate isomerase [Candidatus Ryanbacteria bacterium RIFCSPHIGHO2_01_45_13]OGZ48465.1 MAG: triose-phosphate isomerase [Candidatus Ryanbacteria bacterium RIFCSPHIGHO2_02_FULL_45_43]OGZ50330.1 MAG: triose-phosphate isomerase [Candidatus Ryanbacteria bacterium RIFCSPHIGHO2_12_FULL_44_20]OGZ51669.1 MAG: triose-phosphate isomerase [Candidatus Ryanbacteria bacterium RIFCSPLOWO2_0
MKKLIVANLKMNPNSPDAARKLFYEIRKGARRFQRVHIVICPPFVFLPLFKKLTDNSGGISLGSQNLFWEGAGAYTGEISGAMIRGVGGEYVIVGHSERRAHLAETDEMVRKKLKASFDARLKPVLCVGEVKRDGEGKYFRFIQKQLASALKGVPRSCLSSLAVAYEPVWAIGTGKPATPDDVLEMALFIEKTLSTMFSRKIAAKIRILYGGSVDSANAPEFLVKGRVAGFLVGGQSLHAERFLAIVHASDEVVS